MRTAKDEVPDSLKQLPEDISVEEIQYHIYVRQKIQQDLDAVPDGEVLSREEVERRMSRWVRL